MRTFVEHSAGYINVIIQIPSKLFSNSRQCRSSSRLSSVINLFFFLLFLARIDVPLDPILSQQLVVDSGSQFCSEPLVTLLPLPFLAGLVDAQQLTATATCNTTLRDATHASVRSASLLTEHPL